MVHSLKPSQHSLQTNLNSTAFFCVLLASYLTSPTMSDKCGSCDCANVNQCKKGNKNILDMIVTEKISTEETVLMDAPAAENDGKCKCGTSCGCVNCTCGH